MYIIVRLGEDDTESGDIDGLLIMTVVVSPMRLYRFFIAFIYNLRILTTTFKGHVRGGEFWAGLRSEHHEPRIYMETLDACGIRPTVSQSYAKLPKKDSFPALALKYQ